MIGLYFLTGNVCGIQTLRELEEKDDENDDETNHVTRAHFVDHNHERPKHTETPANTQRPIRMSRG